MPQGQFIGGGTVKGGYVDKTQRMLGQAAQTFSQQDRVAKRNEPGKTVGGGLMAAGSMAASGAMIGSVVPGIGTAVGAVVGGVVGAAGYLLS